MFSQLMKSVLLFLVVAQYGIAATLDVKIPMLNYRAEGFDYQNNLLELALEKSGESYQLTKIPIEANQVRLSYMLKVNDQINVYWMGTSAIFEKELIPVRIPLYRGLLGHRVFIINKHSQHRFDRVKSLDDLQVMLAIQGIGWSDIAILEEAGLPTVATKYKHIFRIMSSGGRADYFPRGVNEAWTEVNQYKGENPNLSVESHVLLVYPFAMFFFVSPNHPDIAAAITKGLKVAYADGSFMAFFNNHPTVKALFEQANMKERVKFVIGNSLMSEETLAIPDEYWHTNMNDLR
ncbi:hypothetical protein MHO82_02255 [Vibrio sp. Of7-15]|uniref:hypothetical protein n=1 Tax=Vibrio sp. Of7-15 TaxID=2724879 RepID=UPI001EF268D9|nr:hypothetical protein [Vibrio sp. Of7-15]MCG7495678.1 hypothetical protein [Vibrio sp. Of7-15]